MEHTDTANNVNIRGDFHSHILPGMDDGASDSSISIAMLMSLKKQNMDFVCLTPHYSYHRESVNDFLTRRNVSYYRLTEALREQSLENDLPQIRLGAEVRVEPDLANDSDICKLCYTGTNALLLELPFSKLENRVYEAIENIALKYRIIPVIAHFERYRKLYSKDDIERIFSIPNAVIQVNAETVQSFTERKFVFSMISQGVSVILGSDAHDMEMRPPSIEKAYGKIDAKVKGHERARFYQTICHVIGHDTYI